MTLDSVFEPFGLTEAEHTALIHDVAEYTLDPGSKLARLRTQRRYSDLGKGIGNLLSSFQGLRSTTGLCYVIAGLKNDPTKTYSWEGALESLYHDPIFTRSRTVWMAFHAALRADSKFALTVAPARAHENTLSGNFISGFTAQCDHWSSHAKGILSRTANPLIFESADISVGGGEQKTGGDFALIIDLEEEDDVPADLASAATPLLSPRRGHQIIPIVFQAKRFVGETADISQRHKSRGYQFDKLRKTACASSYIFYENGASEIEEAVVPIVKPVQNCRAITIEKSTPVFEQSVDFATYLLWAICDEEAFPRASSKEEAINMVCATAKRTSFRRIAFLGNTAGLRNSYQAALYRLSEEIAAQRVHQPQEEIQADIDLPEPPTF
ncbi:hypothetical protein [Brucella pseudogrignonensis]|uniref:hypothetical protein n=1 Tax=Brucella pseudogrignonensis TaxID=419475 RepID=UPI0038D1B3A3